MTDLVIYKYVVDFPWMQVPRGKVVLVAPQEFADKPTVWVLHPRDTEHMMSINIYGTGHAIPADLTANHVGSAVCGDYVWHVFAEHQGVTP